MAKSTLSTDPVSEQDKFMLRLPSGMRDRIKAAADQNGRSMNAEIVATLEEEYPAPRATARFSDLEMLYFQWHDGEWTSIDADSWSRFRFGGIPEHILERMTPGENFFVVAVIDREYGLCNLISQAYKLVDGRIESVAEDYLTEEERGEYSRIWLNPVMTEDDERRLKFLREKMDPAFKLPQKAIAMLRKRLVSVAADEVVERLLNQIS